LVAWFYPVAAGGGHELGEMVLTNRIGIIAIPILFLIRFTLTWRATEQARQAAFFRLYWFSVRCSVLASDTLFTG
jgi:lipid-A-disaccharide synthase-like uncharacterized protein